MTEEYVEILEKVCDMCRWPSVYKTEEALYANRCDGCELTRRIRKAGDAAELMQKSIEEALVPCEKCMYARVDDEGLFCMLRMTNVDEDEGCLKGERDER